MSRFAKKNVTNEEEIEKWLAKERKIRLSEEDVEIAPETLDFNVLYKCIAKRRLKTLYVRGSEHTGEGRARSLHDLALAYKYYKPEITYKEVVIQAYKHLKKHLGKIYLELCYCPDIGKFNFRIHAYPNEQSLNRFWGYINRDLRYIFTSMSGVTVDKIVSRWRDDAEREI